jgi:integrase
MASEMSVPRTAQVFAGRNPATGKVQFLIKTFSREKDAQQWARAMETRKDKGDRPTADRRTLAQFMAQWLGQKAQGAVAGKKKGCKPGPRTMFDYQRLVARWITAPPTGLPNLGAVRLDRLTYQALEAFYDAMGKVTTAGTVRALHKLLRQALEEPARKGALARNPADLANAPRAMRHHGHGVEAEGVVVRTMTREQAEAFLAAARHDRFSALWCVLLLGGLRPGEAFGLRWPDVDFEAGAVRVVRNLIRVPGVKGYTLGPPKTKRSRRTVPLPSLAMRELKSWKVRQAEDHLAAGPAWQDGGFVFTTERGTPLHGARKSFARVCGVRSRSAPTSRARCRSAPSRQRSASTTCVIRARRCSCWRASR